MPYILLIELRHSTLIHELTQIISSTELTHTKHISDNARKEVGY